MYLLVSKSGEYAERYTVFIGVFDSFEKATDGYGEFEKDEEGMWSKVTETYTHPNGEISIETHLELYKIALNKNESKSGRFIFLD